MEIPTWTLHWVFPSGHLKTLAVAWGHFVRLFAGRRFCLFASIPFGDKGNFRPMDLWIHIDSDLETSANQTSDLSLFSPLIYLDIAHIFLICGHAKVDKSKRPFPSYCSCLLGRSLGKGDDRSCRGACGCLQANHHCRLCYDKMGCSKDSQGPLDHEEAQSRGSHSSKLAPRRRPNFILLMELTTVVKRWM